MAFIGEPWPTKRTGMRARVAPSLVHGAEAAARLDPPARDGKPESTEPSSRVTHDVRERVDLGREVPESDVAQDDPDASVGLLLLARRRESREAAEDARHALLESDAPRRGPFARGDHAAQVVAGPVDAAEVLGEGREAARVSRSRELLGAGRARRLSGPRLPRSTNDADTVGPVVREEKPPVGRAGLRDRGAGDRGGREAREETLRLGVSRGAEDDVRGRREKAGARRGARSRNLRGSTTTHIPRGRGPGAP